LIFKAPVDPEFLSFEPYNNSLSPFFYAGDVFKYSPDRGGIPEFKPTGPAGETPYDTFE